MPQASTNALGTSLGLIFSQKDAQLLQQGVTVEKREKK